MNGKDLLQVVRDQRMGFCMGMATLAVVLPPNIETWLSGEMDKLAQATVIAAAAAVLRGILWCVFSAFGLEPPVSLQSKEKTDA